MKGILNMKSRFKRRKENKIVILASCTVSSQRCNIG